MDTIEESQPHIAKRERTLRLEKVASWILMATAFLLPIFFIPSASFSIPFAKSLLLYVGVIITLVAFLFSVLESGTLRLPASPVYYVAFSLPVIFLISSLSSSSIATSLVGYGVEVGTFAFVLLMVVLMTLVSYLYRTKERIFYSYLLYFASFGIVAVYQLLRLAFGGTFLSLGLFTQSVSNLVGSWNDLGVFFTVAALLATITLELLSLNKLFKALLYAALVVSLAFVSIVNFQTLWYILGSFSLAFLLFVLFSFRERAHALHEGEQYAGRKISYLSLAVLVLSIVFIIGGTALGSSIAGVFKISNFEVRPSWSTTLSVTNQTLSHNLLLGSGPNTFQNDWGKYKPGAINTTAFWNTDFNYGIGLIPTFLSTTGILGFLAWLALLGCLLYTGFKAIFSNPRDQLARYFIISSFLASVCLWTILIVYVPSMAIVALAFFFTGLFLASISNENLVRHKEIALYGSARVGFATVLASVFALILAITGGYYMVKGFVSSSHFQNSLAAASANDTAKAATEMQAAIALRGYDIYYRSLAQIYMLQLNALLGQQNADPATLRQQFQSGLGQAIQAGIKSTTVDPGNYQNFSELGQIYESVVPAPFKIDGAYQKAKDAYDAALSLNPQDPELHLLEGRLEMAQGNNDAARTDINVALQQKPDYVDAYFILSQVEVAAGDLPKAISSVESAVYLAPDNAGVYFQLGLLKYNSSDWNGAIQAFEKAISLVPNYANAKYFLGLSYDKVGRHPDAIKQFQDLSVSNPDNADVTSVLKNLQAGNAPFAGAASSTSAAPEKATNPPIKQ